VPLVFARYIKAQDMNAAGAGAAQMGSNLIFARDPGTPKGNIA
jgi:hypothetical protein